MLDHLISNTLNIRYTICLLEIGLLNDNTNMEKVEKSEKNQN